MPSNGDKLSEEILKIVVKAAEPLETKEIEKLLEDKVKEATRIKVIWRLQNLRGEGRIKGKMIGGGKGVWVWWVDVKSRSKNE